MTNRNKHIYASVSLTHFYPRDVYKRGTCYGNVAGWVAGWLAGCLSVTRRYCIKTAKPILKLFQPSGSPISETGRDRPMVTIEREQEVMGAGSNGIIFDDLE